MKNNTLLIVLFCGLSFLSCENNETQLHDKIKRLEAENSKLKAGLDSIESKKITSSQLFLLPTSLSFQLNKPNTIAGILNQDQNFPHYDLYLADENYNFKESDKVNLKTSSGSQFEFEYTPKNVKDETVRVVAVFDLDTMKVKLSARLDLPVR